MIFNVQLTIMPLNGLLDPQGKAVMGGLSNLGITSITDVRVGKHITLQIEAPDANAAKVIGDDAAKKMLVNAVMEQYEITVN